MAEALIVGVCGPCVVEMAWLLLEGSFVERDGDQDGETLVDRVILAQVW